MFNQKWKILTLIASQSNGTDMSNNEKKLEDNKMQKTLLGAACILFLIAGCDVKYEVSVNADETITESQTAYFDDAGCEIAAQVTGKKICGGLDKDGTPATTFDEDLNQYIRVLEEPKTKDFASYEDSESPRYVFDTSAKTFEFTALPTDFQNMSRGPTSVEDQPVAQTLGFGPLAAYEGKTVELIVNAAKIIETNGITNKDNTSVTFEVPASFMAYGIGKPGYDILFVKGIYDDTNLPGAEAPGAETGVDINTRLESEISARAVEAEAEAKKAELAEAVRNAENIARRLEREKIDQERNIANIRSRGLLRCGVLPGNPGLYYSPDGSLAMGIHADICRAIAIAIFESTDKVEFVHVNHNDGLDKLSRGAIDILVDGIPRSITKIVNAKAVMPIQYYYDTTGFAVPVNPNPDEQITSALEFEKPLVCTLNGAVGADDWYLANGIFSAEVHDKVFLDTRSLINSFEKDGCDIVFGSTLSLFSLRSDSEKTLPFSILFERVDSFPIGPLVRQDATKLAQIVKAVVSATIQAELAGVTSENLDERLQEPITVSMSRLIGSRRGETASAFSLQLNWAREVIRSVGNHAEILDRNLEMLKWRRKGSANDSWTRGGLSFAPPF